MYGSALKRWLCAAGAKAGRTRRTQGQRAKTREAWIEHRGRAVLAKARMQSQQRHFKRPFHVDETEREKMNLPAPWWLWLESGSREDHATLALSEGWGCTPWGLTSPQVWLRFQPHHFVSSWRYDSSDERTRGSWKQSVIN